MPGQETATSQNAASRCNKYSWATMLMVPLSIAAGLSYGVYRLALHLGADENTAIGAAAGTSAGIAGAVAIASLVFCRSKPEANSRSERAEAMRQPLTAPEAGV